MLRLVVLALLALNSIAAVAGKPGHAAVNMPPSPTIIRERPLIEMLKAVRAAVATKAGCDGRFAPRDAARLLLGVQQPVPLVEATALSFAVQSDKNAPFQYSVMIDCRGRKTCGSYSLHVGPGLSDSIATAEQVMSVFGRDYSHYTDMTIPVAHLPPNPPPGSLGEVSFDLAGAGSRLPRHCPKTVHVSFDDNNKFFSATIVSGE